MLKKSPKTKTVRKTKSDDGPKSRAEWVDKIQKVHAKTAAAIIELGQILIDAKQALDKHGQWMIMFERQELPFSLSLAERYMKIAGDHKLSKSANLQNLPSPVSVLYELSRLPDDVFDQAIADGKINPTTTRQEAVALGTKRAAAILTRIEDHIIELNEVTPDQIDDDCRKRARKLGEQLFAWAQEQLLLTTGQGQPAN